jgi:hypothetical protein
MLLACNESDGLGHSDGDRHGDEHGNEHADRYAVADADRYVVSDPHRDDRGDTNRVRVQLWVGFGCGPICGHSPSCRDLRLAARRNSGQRVA